MTCNTIAYSRRLGLGGALVLALCASVLGAQDVPVEQEKDAPLENIVVTAARIRQGGAQDIRHFRSVSLSGDFLPQSFDLTVEGLMGEHDLTLPETRPCFQTFCLTGAAMPAALPLRAGDEWFVGLGFSSNIDAEKYRREPISLIAVVDRSGSMEGWPIEQVKAAMHTMVGKLRKGDRIGIVTYGSEPDNHMKVIEVSGNTARIYEAIDTIGIEGGTALEEGLKAGYAMARDELAHSHGKTRLMLFTDENPNIGDTSAQGFMAQAIAGSHQKIGLTTFGVGVHFDAELATRVSSVRGGNLFFIDDEGSAKQLFDREFYNMVNEVAQDIELTFTPPRGMRITGVFGVPDDLMTTGSEGAMTVRISSAFLSSNGGGIYLTLGKDRDHADLPMPRIGPAVPLLTGTLRYVDARSGNQAQDRIEVAMPQGSQPPRGLAKAMLLVDEFVTLRSALAAYHERGDKKAAFQQLDGLDRRLSASGLGGLEAERKLVGGLRERAAYLAGYSGELPRALKPLALKGDWQVVRQYGLEDIARGDSVEITDEGEFITSRRRGEDINQRAQVNERQVRLVDAGLVFNYNLRGDRLTMVTEDGTGGLELRREAHD